MVLRFFVNIFVISLVSNENFSEILLSSSCAQVKYQHAKMVKNLLHLWRHSQKKQNPKRKKNFSLQTQTVFIVSNEKLWAGCIFFTV